MKFVFSEMNNTEVQKAPFWVLLMYSLGQMGWSLAIYGVGNLLTYFYMPPGEGTEAVFPSYIFQGAILGIATVIGLISFGGRIFDAITDPWIAGMSDRSKSKFGRRRTFMALSFIPFALFSYLVFYPLSNGVSSLNTIWLVGTISLFYFFFTLYVTPYTALISELGHNSNERLTISTFISVTFALGLVVGTQIFALQEYFQAQGLSSTEAFQKVMGIFALVSAVLMALPVLFVNEEKYCLKGESDEGSYQAVKSVFSNKNFNHFIASDLMYWFAVTFIQMGIAYYVTILLGLDAAYTSGFLVALLLGSFVLYIPINYYARRIGKKPIIILAFLCFLICFALIFILGKLPLSNMVQLGIVGVVSILPMAIFGILPNAIIADIADLDGQKTGNYKSGMYFAARAFMMKIGISFANLLFPSLLLLGKSVDNDLGIRMTGVVAFLFCGLGLYFFTKYNEEPIVGNLS